MAFTFEDWMVNHYLSQGYLVMRGLVPPALIDDLRREIDKARVLAHEIGGPFAHRLQPVDKYADQLNVKPFQDYCELPELHEGVEQLLGSGYTGAHTHIMGILVEPQGRPWNQGWHRDGVVEVPLEAQEDPEVKAALAERWHDLRTFNQVNCAIYAESCLWYVPGSHLRQWDLPGEVQTVGSAELAHARDTLPNGQAERFFLDHCRERTGAVQMHLGPGDFMIYRNLGWHCGSIVEYQPRGTIHDAVLYHGKDPVLDRSETAFKYDWVEVKKRTVERLRQRQAQTISRD